MPWLLWKSRFANICLRVSKCIEGTVDECIGIAVRVLRSNRMREEQETPRDFFREGLQ